MVKKKDIRTFKKDFQESFKSLNLIAEPKKDKKWLIEIFLKRNILQLEKPIIGKQLNP